MTKQIFRGFLAATLVLSQAALADRVELNNGDSLSGTIVEQKAGKLVLDTAFAGKIEINSADVRSIQTDKPMQFTLSDGRTVEGIIQTTAGGETIITGMDQSAVTLPGLNAVAGIGAIPPSGPPPLVWHGNALAAGTRVRGNTDTDSYSLGGRIVGEQKAIHRITGYATLNRELNDGSLTKEQYLLGAKYDRFFTAQWYGYAAADFEKDKFKDLDLRSIFSAGVGYQFFNTDDLKVSLEGGLSYTDERFDTASDDSYAGFNWGFNWEQKLLDGGLDFFHRHRGIKGFDTASNVIVSAQTGFRFPLLAGLNATVEWDLDYDNDPPKGVKEADHTYKVGVGYSW